ncbi:hypothetical protein [Streptomyces roseochromogenus]|uniref:Uncharacterized protein n=1 Tax=Streptomyces roseochromogenus subsp. oscitans DS 12.976 TaxID=1352936 RepID=V6JH55_STRRC|nr:hypothetical protein [Streptomyces roseochromogenus]EST18491.1 hypothetical protein M878_45055 [Streptomyces roseochromogenus subsp. oscitans DS 12.976]
MKRRKVYGPDRDPVSRHVGEPLLDGALRALLKPGELGCSRRLSMDFTPTRSPGCTA